MSVAITMSESSWDLKREQRYQKVRRALCGFVFDLDTALELLMPLLNTRLDVEFEDERNRLAETLRRQDELNHDLAMMFWEGIDTDGLIALTDVPLPDTIDKVAYRCDPDDFPFTHDQYDNIRDHYEDEEEGRQVNEETTVYLDITHPWFCLRMSFCFQWKWGVFNSSVECQSGKVDVYFKGKMSFLACELDDFQSENTPETRWFYPDIQRFLGAYNPVICAPHALTAREYVATRVLSDIDDEENLDRYNDIVTKLCCHAIAVEEEVPGFACKLWELDITAEY